MGTKFYKCIQIKKAEMLRPDFTLPSRKKDARGVSMWLSNVLKTKTHSIANMKAASL